MKEIAAASGTTGGPIAGHSEIVADGAGVSFATHICDIEVDPETYEVRADGEVLSCEPMPMLPMAQRYFLF